MVQTKLYDLSVLEKNVKSFDNSEKHSLLCFQTFQRCFTENFPEVLEQLSLGANVSAT